MGRRNSFMPHAGARAGGAIALALAAAALVSGCGSSEPRLEASVDTMVEFEATWQCDVVRFAYESPDQIETRQDRVRDRFGVTADDHKIFTGMVEADDELRDAVATRNDELCPIVEN